MKRFLVFAWEQYYPCGGFNDLVGNYDTYEECEVRVDQLTYENYEIVDLQTGERIRNWEIARRKKE